VAGTDPFDARPSDRGSSVAMPAKPATSPGQPRDAVILFDGDCRFCNGAVRFILRRDRRGHFRFASLQGKTGRALLSALFPAPAGAPDSLVLVEDGRVFVHSDAVLRIAGRLGPGWALLSFLAAALPRPFRDGLYRQFARRRHRLFGRRDRCMVPPPEWKARILD